MNNAGPTAKCPLSPTSSQIYGRTSSKIRREGRSPSKAWSCCTAGRRRGSLLPRWDRPLGPGCSREGGCGSAWSHLWSGRAGGWCSCCLDPNEKDGEGIMKAISWKRKLPLDYCLLTLSSCSAAWVGSGLCSCSWCLWSCRWHPLCPQSVTLDTLTCTWRMGQSAPSRARSSMSVCREGARPWCHRISVVFAWAHSSFAHGTFSECLLRVRHCADVM